MEGGKGLLSRYYPHRSLLKNISAHAAAATVSARLCTPLRPPRRSALLSPPSAALSGWSQRRPAGRTPGCTCSDSDAPPAPSKRVRPHRARQIRSESALRRREDPECGHGALALDVHAAARVHPDAGVLQSPKSLAHKDRLP